jgi:hypothetical protein
MSRQHQIGGRLRMIVAGALVPDLSLTAVSRQPAGQQVVENVHPMTSQ